jgi:membrane-bound lytic murein transglycosylase D
VGQFFRDCTVRVMRFQLAIVATFLLIALSSAAGRVFAAPSPFTVPPELEGAVDFWKQIFTRYSTGEVVFFDPLDHGRIYSVARIPEGAEARGLIENERARIVADHDLGDGERRVRSQRGAKERFVSGIKISGRYLSRMQKIFRDEGLPADLAYLPLVESSFNVHARSSAGAVGMWQFMPDTGKKFMRITDALDERRDPMVSTRAAARLLKENRRLLGNWPMAITAYNHGTEGLFRGIEAVGSADLVQIIRGYESPLFGFASKNFYAEFLAAAEIAKNRDAYFPSVRPHPPVSLHEVEIGRPLPVHRLLKPAAISQKDFYEWNPALSPATKLIPAGYRVKLPPEKVKGFAAAQRRVAEAPAVRKAAVAKKNNDGRAVKKAARSGSAKRAVTRRTTPESKELPAAKDGT